MYIGFVDFVRKWPLAIIVFCFLACQSALATVYSDAESGLDGWTVFDNTPAGATVTVVTDSRIQSRVIQTQGAGRSNGYLLGGRNAVSGWNNATETQFEWRMSTSEPYVVQVYIETTLGLRRLIYSPSNADSLRNPFNNSIAFGLGSTTTDGVWRTHSRNLSNDVSIGEPGNELVVVYGLVVLGSLRLDDVSLLAQPPDPAIDTPPVAGLTVNPNNGVAPLPVQADASGSVDDDGIALYEFDFGDGTQTSGTSATANHVYTSAGSYTLAVRVTDSLGQSDDAAQSITVTEPAIQSTVYSNAEDGIGDWVVFDNRPAGASITTVFDSDFGSQVIQTQGDGRSNSYTIGGISASSGWNNQSEFILSWDMSTDEPFGIGVAVDTTLGLRRMIYNQSNANSLRNPFNNTIHFGLGSATIGGGWISHERDLAQDVAVGEPGNQLLRVNGFLVAGSVRLDNVTLSTASTEPPDVDPPDVDPPDIDPPVNTAPNAVISVNASSGEVPLTVSFGANDSSAVSPATITQYRWEFGNATSANSVNGSATYTRPGNYTVNLTITDSTGLRDSATTVITVRENDTTPPGVDSGSAAAARLLAQAAFGASLSEIDRVRALGIEGWIDDQLTQVGSSHLDYAINYPGSGSLTGPRQHKWMIDAIEAPDQLRNRVAYALSQIFVTSDTTQVLRREQYAMANYYDLLRDNAFVNYRDLLERVTLSPIMGIYLSMLQNAPGDPSNNSRADENYAREIMQLFSIGLFELNNDGTVRNFADGRPRPAYTQSDVEC